GGLDRVVPAQAARYADEDLTCLIGPGERVLAFLEQVRRLRGDAPAAGIYPRLTAVIHTAGSPGVTEALRGLLGAGPLLLQALSPPDAPLAVEDPRRPGLRLLCEHGVYLEFTTEGADDPHAPRRGLDEVRPGEPYEVALTSPAGLWACRTGLIVAFEEGGPPRVRLLASVPVPSATSAPPPSHPPEGKARGPHRQSAGIPAARPEKLVRSPGSAHAGRG